VREGLDSESLWWEGHQWEKGFLSGTQYFRNARFNRFKNPSFEMRLSFAGTSYEHVASWSNR